MEDKMRQAGVAVDRSRLASETYEALRRMNRDPERATNILIQAVLADVRLLNALLGINLRATAEQYVRERLQDMEGLAGAGSQMLADSHGSSDPAPVTSSEGASQRADDSQSQLDRPSTPSPDASQKSSESLLDHDRSGTTREGGASHRVIESQGPADRPAPVPVSQTRKAGAVAAMRRAADYIIPGTASRRLGSITQHDRLNLHAHRARADASDDAFTELENAGEIRWPNMNTPLEDFADPVVLQKLETRLDEANRLAIERIKQVAYGH